MSDVPSEAAAVDVPCPFCGERPVEQAAKAARVSGFLIAYSIKRKTVIGCATCTRKELLKAAAGTMLTGWWSITSAILNPFVLLYDLLRAPYNRGPTDGLVEAIEAEGIEVTFLEHRDEFDPAGKVSPEVLLDEFETAESGGATTGGAADVEEQVLLEGLIQLAGAVMLADGRPSTAQAERLRDDLRELFPDRDPAELERLIQAHIESDPDVTTVTGELAGSLTEDGEDLVLDVAIDVALADGEIRDADVGTIAEICDGLGMDMDEDTVEMLVAVRAGEDIDAALDGLLDEADA